MKGHHVPVVDESQESSTLTGRFPTCAATSGRKVVVAVAVEARSRKVADAIMLLAAAPRQSCISCKLARNLVVRIVDGEQTVSIPGSGVNVSGAFPG